MKYYVMYMATPDRVGNVIFPVTPNGKSVSIKVGDLMRDVLEFETAEDAFAEIPRRAAQYGNQASDYRVQCGMGAEAKLISSAAEAHLTDSANPKQAFGDKKLPVHLVPPALMLEAALNMGDGAEKYGPYNWRHKKVEAMTYVAAIQRHLAAFLDGEDVDPESKRGATHLGAIAACVGILTDARNMGNLIDNRPPKGSAGDMIRKAAGVVIPPLPKDSK